MEKKLDVLNKLSGFRVVAKHITDDKRKGKYHLVTLDLDSMKANIQSFQSQFVHKANEEYSKKEEEVSAGRNIQVVLVTSESIAALKKAYPSYFLDSQNFARKIRTVYNQLERIKNPKNKTRQGRKVR